MFKKHRKKSRYGDPGELPGLSPNSGKATNHPNAANFPQVGMTFAAYRQSGRTGPRATAQLTRWQRFRLKWSKKRIAKWTVIIIILIVIAFFGHLLYDLGKAFGGNIFGLFNTTKLRGEDVGRVNILLAGNSADDPGHQGADLTDSIMIVSIDTRNNSAFLLSIPRDLWVNIPGNGYAKINSAYVDGQNENFHQSGYPSGGMGLLQEVIEQKFGITIDYNVLIDYAALRDAVNAVGGINIDIQSQDPRGLYDPSIDYATGGPLVKLSNGWHHIDGEQALDLARARGDAYGSYGFDMSDFDRTANQRQMLIALTKKIDTTSTLTNPITVTKLFDTIGAHVRSNFNLSELKRLKDIMGNIPASKIRSVSLNNVNGQDLLTSYDAYGESALIPAAGINNYSAIDHFVQQLTSNNPVVKENASVVLLNATNTFGLAAKNSDELKSTGVNVVGIGDASANLATTTIIDNSKGKDPATLRFLKSRYNATSTTVNPYAGKYNAAFIVVLGADQVGVNH